MPEPQNARDLVYIIRMRMKRTQLDTHPNVQEAMKDACKVNGIPDWRTLNEANAPGIVQLMACLTELKKYQK